MTVLVIQNIDIETDTKTFSNDRGSWNVSRALRDCAAGKHQRWLIDVADAYAKNVKVEVEEAKIEALLRTQEPYPPLLSVVEGGELWLIDGHHRLRALHRLGIKEWQSFVIEEADSAPYIIWFNGERQAPFPLY